MSVRRLPAASTACTRNATRSDERRPSARRTARVPRAVSRSRITLRRPTTSARCEDRNVATPRIRPLTVARHASSVRSVNVSRRSRRTLRRPLTRADTRQARRVGRHRGRRRAHGRRRRRRACRRRPVHDPEHRPGERHGEQAPAGVLPERAQRGHGEAGRGVAGAGEVGRTQLGDAAVAVDVAAEQRRQAGIAYDVAARDRAEAFGMELLQRGRRRAGGAGGVAHPRRIALEARPAVVGRQAEVDLLDGVLADVGDRDLPGRAIEREAPRVAQAARDHLRSGCRGIEPDQLAEQGSRVLRVGTVGAVAGRQPQLPVGPELQLTAVVVGRHVVTDRQHHPPAGRVGDVGVGGRAPVLAHLQLAFSGGRGRRGRRQVDVEAPGGRVVRRERRRQQAALAAVRRDRRQVEERRREHAPSRISRTRPACSVTKTRAASPGGDVA